MRIIRQLINKIRYRKKVICCNIYYTLNFNVNHYVHQKCQPIFIMNVYDKLIAFDNILIFRREKIIREDLCKKYDLYY